MSMKALTYVKPGVIAWQQVDKPTIQEPTDVIGKVVATTICGTDLHIWKGDCPETTEVATENGERGIILGHEAIIEVESVGSGVKKFAKGDICIVSCITSCGKCYYCKKNIQSHCAGNGYASGWSLGHFMDGTQSEYMRVAHADYSLFKAPKDVPYEKLLMLCDALPTAYEIGVLSGKVKENDSIAIVGLGPVGLSAFLTAKPLKPKQIICIDLDDGRLALAKKLGATHTINSGKFSHDEVVQQVMEITSNLYPDREAGVDVAIECVGIPYTFELCQDLITCGGSVANVGVHGKSVDLKLQNLWIKNINISTGLVSAYSLPELLDEVAKGSIDPSPIITHHFKFDEFEHAYDVFKNAATTKAMKIVLTP